MTVELSTRQGASLPTWFWIAAILGLAWNVFGAYQYLMSVQATQESLVSSGLTAEQAAVMLNYPAWMTGAFAIAVFGGIIGCALLLLRKRLSVPVLALSLAASISLFIGDMINGIFAAMGAPQVIVLTIVVLISVLMLWIARRFSASGALT
jgi:hypothetical protein